MVSGDGKAVRLARRLRELREHEWPDRTLTQAELARALGVQGRVAPATVSSWESLTSPKTPTTARLHAYARFFATSRSMDGTPRLLALDELDDDERERFKQLEAELLALHAAIDDQSHAAGAGELRRRALLYFAGAEPVVVICPELPKDVRGPFADERNVNHTRLHRFADSDALLEVFGHIRALNPELHVLPRLPSEIQRADLQNHIVLLGGISWNKTMRRILTDLERKLPIEQFEDERVPEGEVFRVKKDDERDEQTYLPEIEVDGAESELVEDVGLLARLPNSFNFSRTMTICNGIHSKGVLGAVLAITDETVRPANEQYLAERFPAGDFAMLVRVPVVSGHPIAPDLQNPHTRLFEWPPESTVGE